MPGFFGNLYDQMLGLSPEDFVDDPLPKRAHGSMPTKSRILRKSKIVSVPPSPVADPSTFSLTGANWDSGINFDKDQQAKVSTDPYLGEASQDVVHPHMDNALDALSKIGANKRMAQPDPRDAQLFAEGAEAEMSRPGPRQWEQGDFKGSLEPNAEPVLSGQQPIAKHLEARFPKPLHPRTDSEKAAAIRRYEEQITARMAQTAREGNRRGYTNVPYDVVDGIVTTPEGALPERSMSDEDMQRIRSKQNAVQKSTLDNDGSLTYQDENAPKSDSVVRVPDANQGFNKFRSGTGRAYVDLQKEALRMSEDAVKGGSRINPLDIPTNTLVGTHDPYRLQKLRDDDAARRKDMFARIKSSREADASRRSINADARKAQQLDMDPRDYETYRALVSAQGDPRKMQAILSSMDPKSAELAMEKYRIDQATKTADKRTDADIRVAEESANARRAQEMRESLRDDNELAADTKILVDPDKTQVEKDEARIRIRLRRQQIKGGNEGGAGEQGAPTGSTSATSDVANQILKAGDKTYVDDYLSTIADNPDVYKDDATLADVYRKAKARLPLSVLKEIKQRDDDYENFSDWSVGGFGMGQAVPYNRQNGNNWITRKLVGRPEESKRNHDRRLARKRFLQRLIDIAEKGK